MKQANSANGYTIKRHRLIQQHEIIHFQDQHCPIQIFTEEAINWITISNEPISLENYHLNPH